MRYHCGETPIGWGDLLWRSRPCVICGRKLRPGSIRVHSTTSEGYGVHKTCSTRVTQRCREAEEALEGVFVQRKKAVGQEMPTRP